MEVTSNITARMIIGNQTELSTVNDWADLEAFWWRPDLIQRSLTIFNVVFATLWNALVLIVTCREKCFHQPNKYFIFLLAVANLFVGLFMDPFLAYQLGLGSTSSDQDNMSTHPCRYMVWMDTLTVVIVLIDISKSGNHLCTNHEWPLPDQ